MALGLTFIFCGPWKQAWNSMVLHGYPRGHVDHFGFWVAAWVALICTLAGPLFINTFSERRSYKHRIEWVEYWGWSTGQSVLKRKGTANVWQARHEMLLSLVAPLKRGQRIGIMRFVYRTSSNTYTNIFKAIPMSLQRASRTLFKTGLWEGSWLLRDSHNCFVRLFDS